jgi:flagellar protein FlbT
MPLKLSLRPGERFVVNGAVVQNGDRRASLILQNKASVLREKDIMQIEDATSPARRIYLPVMLLYLDQGDEKDLYAAFSLRLSEFSGVVRNPDILAECVSISREVMAGDYYKALLRCRKLIAYEDAVLGLVNDDTSISAHRDAG